MTLHDALSALTAFYGPIPLPPRELFAFVVWDLISLRAVPARRDRAWQALKLIPALTPDALFRASNDELSSALEGIGGGGERLDALREVGGHFRRHRDLSDRVTRSLLDAGRVMTGIPHLSASARSTAPLLVGGHPVAALDEGAARVIGRLHGIGSGRGRREHRVARRRLVAETGPRREVLSRAVVVLGHHASHACCEHAPHCGVCAVRAGCASARGGTPPAMG